MAALGVKWIVFTDIGSDGMLQGPNLCALQEMVSGVDADIIASGGVSSLDDIKAVRDAGAAGAIIGMALYSGRISLQDAMEASC
jgi:phosphoribosylformimino-5-aminoimidazole carboxamide ribotide isomerase